MSTSHFVCYNPHCNSRLKCFANEKGYTMHFQLSPSCFQYFCQHATASLNARSHAVGTKQNILESNNATVMTTKSPSLLRHHMVNDISHTVQNVFLMNNEDQKNSFDAVDNHEGDHFSSTVPAMLPTAEVSPIEPFMFTTDQKWTIALLNVFDDMNAPDHAFKDVLSWARDANADGYSFCPDGGLSRMRSVDLLFKTMKNAETIATKRNHCHRSSWSTL
jgi:hypothetical protein